MEAERSPRQMGMQNLPPSIWAAQQLPQPEGCWCRAPGAGAGAGRGGRSVRRPAPSQQSSAAGCSEPRWPSAATGEGSGAQRRSLSWNRVRAGKALYPETFPAAASIEWSFQEAAPIHTPWLLKTQTPALLQHELEHQPLMRSFRKCAAEIRQKKLGLCRIKVQTQETRAVPSLACSTVSQRKWSCFLAGVVHRKQLGICTSVFFNRRAAPSGPVSPV